VEDVLRGEAKKESGEHENRPGDDPPLSMPTLGPGGDFNRTASRMDPKPSRPAIGAASVYPFGRHQTIRASSQLGE